MEKNRLWVVIAAYNEGQAIAETVVGVLAHAPNVVVVDDCSTDETASRALAAGAHVLRHPINLGQGGALQTGIDYALQQGAQCVVTFDADGQHNPAEILPIASALVASGAEVALGSRFIGQAINLHWERRLVLKLAILFTRLTTRIKLTDVHNGFRAMSRSFCEQFRFRQNRMAHASEILNYIAANDVPYMEFPVSITYSEYSMRKGQRSSNALRILMELFMGHIGK